MLAAFLLPQIAGAVIDIVIGMFVPGYTAGLTIALFSILFLFIYCRKRRLSITKLTKETSKNAIIFLLPNIINIIVSAIQLVTGARTFGGFTYQVFAISLMAGVSEEIAFRGVPISHILTKKPAEKTIPISVAVTSILFGAVHLSNVAGGVTWTMAIYQATAAACLGVLYAAVFLRTKSVLPTILAHFTNDVVGLLDSGSTANGLMTNITLTKLDYIDIAFAAVYLIVGIYIVRPAKHKEILELWKKDEEQND